VRVVLDTNVLLAGLFWHGPPHALLEKVRSGELTMLCSPELLNELAEVLARPKFRSILARSKSSREDLVAEVRELGEVITPPPLPDSECRDRDDNHVLALAMAGHCDWIITGDEDLLVLLHYHQTAIVTPANALELLCS
jgi:putative PIN family toxin of toxin-antitoxin system